MNYFKLPDKQTKYTEEEFEIMIEEMLYSIKNGSSSEVYEINLAQGIFIETKYGVQKEVNFSQMLERLTEIFFTLSPIPRLLYKPERNLIKQTIEKMIKNKPQQYLKLYEKKPYNNGGNTM